MDDDLFGSDSSSEEERTEIKRSERKQIRSIQSSSESENESDNNVNNDDSDKDSDDMPRNRNYRKLKKSSSYNDDRSLNFDSDNERENTREDLSDNEKNDAGMEDLFGSDEEKSSDEDLSDDNRNNIISRERSRTRSRSSSRSRSPSLEKKVISIDVSIPNLEPPSKKNSNIYLAKLPNFLDIEPEPFDPLTYKGVEEEEARLRENVIRWRYKKDKNNNYLPDQKESNARFIKWSDGSLSLLLGDEMFEVNLNEIDSHQYIIVHHSKQGVLQTQAQLKNSMAFQPYGIKSLTHKKLTASIAEKHQRAVKTKMFTGEHNKNDLRQEIKDNRRINQKLERLQQKKNKPKNTENTRSHTRNNNNNNSDEEESYSQKSRYNRYEDEGDSEDFIVDDDEYDEEEEREREKEERILKAKREGERQRRREEERKRIEKQRELSRKRKFEEHADLFDDEGSNEEFESESESDDNEDVTIKKKTKKRQVLMSDDEE
ncbi:Leo1-domain-containing protein [Piromyces finnis]|uniref:Leo1-domain-containing protein n=1 Tax=Piromyces finnis TaxID=1754191 RepID=A0A1Y1UVM1_9FUNG|nr:Leo1-domain-containing protein [Piromyces finnis]|eukprot:ORX42030.1 Leo1-domain-containing protein [Piromyces finnis]